MKNYKNLFSVVAVAMAFVSCSKDADVDEFAAPEVDSRMITAVVDIDATRTSLNTDRSQLQWTAGEKFGVFSEQAADRNLESTAYTAGTLFVIRNLSEEAETLYAYYPMNTVNNNSKYSATSAYLTIESSQTQEAAGVLNGKYYPMTAVGQIQVDDEEKETVELLFKPWACALALNIYGGSIDERVVSVKFKSETPSSGSMDGVDLTADEFTYEATRTETSVRLAEAARFAPVDEKNGDRQAFQKQVYLVVARQDYPGGEFEVVTTSAAGEKTYTFTTKSTIACANYDFYAMNINLTKAASSLQSASNIYPLTFSAGTAGHANAEVSVEDGVYSISLTGNGGHGEHYGLTDPLVRSLNVGTNQKVELVFTYKTPTTVTADSKWQFTSFFNPPYYTNSTVDNQTMAFSTSDNEWLTCRLDLTTAIANTGWGKNVAGSKIRFRFRMVRKNGVIDYPQCPEQYGFTEIDIKNAYLEVTNTKPEPEPATCDPTFEVSPINSYSDFAGKFAGTGVSIASGEESSEADAIHFKLFDNGERTPLNYLYTDVLSEALEYDLTSQRVEISFLYKAQVNGTIDNAAVGGWYNRWFFKFMPVIDGMTETDYQKASNAQEIGNTFRGDNTQTDNLRFGTEKSPMEWLEYRMELNSSFASRDILDEWGKNLTKHPQLRLDFRARVTTNNDCPFLSLGLTDVWIKDLKITVRDI